MKQLEVIWYPDHHNPSWLSCRCRFNLTFNNFMQKYAKPTNMYASNTLRVHKPNSELQHKHDLYSQRTWLSGFDPDLEGP